MARKRILLIDDDDEYRNYLANVLVGEPFEVSQADSGPSGLAVAGRSGPDLVVLDVNMPGMDGFEVCRRLKEDERTRDIPVLLLTASNREQDILRGFEVGADDFLAKPISTGQFRAKIRTWLIRGTRRDPDLQL